MYSCAVVLNGISLAVPRLGDGHAATLMAKMGYIGESYKVFYEVMPYYSVFNFLPSKELYILSC